MAKIEYKSDDGRNSLIVDSSSLTVTSSNIKPFEWNFDVPTLAGVCYVEAGLKRNCYPADRNHTILPDLTGYAITFFESPTDQPSMHVECFQSSPKTAGEPRYTQVGRTVVDKEGNLVQIYIMFVNGIPQNLSLRVKNKAIEVEHIYWPDYFKEQGPVFRPESIFDRYHITPSVLQTFIDTGLPLNISFDEVTEMGRKILNLDDRSPVLPKGQILGINS